MRPTRTRLDDRDISPEDPRPWLEIRRRLRRHEGRRTWRVELFGVLLVLAATTATVGWLGPRTRIDLEGLGAAAAGMVPTGQPPHPFVGHARDSQTALFANGRPT
jgi:hypothetical protein